VDENCRWDFFWARDADQKCLLVLKHTPQNAPAARLPTLNGIDLSDVPYEEGVSKILVFRLVDGAQRTIFERLCRDIISATSLAESEAEAIRLAVARTWRWHHLLRGGSSGLLS